EVLLALSQNVHPEPTLLLQERKQVGGFINAHRHQGRNQRNRGKRVGGHAVRPPRRAFDGDDRYPGGKLAESPAGVEGRAGSGWGGGSRGRSGERMTLVL